MITARPLTRRRRATRILTRSALGTLAVVAIATGTTMAVASPSPGTSGVNADGQTFGSAASSHSVSEEPDLIQAQATNGTLGYVRKTDLEQSPASIAEAMALTKKTQAGYTIPVYASDGKSLVGEFRIGGSSGPGATDSVGR